MGIYNSDADSSNISNSIINTFKNDNDTYLVNGYNEGYSKGVEDGLSGTNIRYIYHTHKYVSTDGTIKETTEDDYTKISDFASDQDSDLESCWSGTIEEKTCHWHNQYSGSSVSWYCSMCGCDRPFRQYDEIHDSCGGSRYAIGGRSGRECTDKVHGRNQGPLPSGTHTYTVNTIAMKCGKTSSTIESATVGFD